MESTKLFSPHRFCRILAEARSAKVRGSWEGSAFRSHPCGLIVGNMKLTNYWNVNDYCSIVLGTTDKWRMGQNNPACGGDPHPHPIDGAEVRVWYSGRWESEEFRTALEGKVVAILNRALVEIAARKSWDLAIVEHANYCVKKKHAEVARVALNLAGV